MENAITDKRGGICFRVDDNHPTWKWTDFAQVFNRYGYKFCAALNPGRMIGNDAYIAMVRELQDQGHEIMDHTPLHSVDKLPLLSEDDPDTWRSARGVDHVDEKLIYLSYEKPEVASISEGRADISGKTMKSRIPGDLSEPNRSKFIAVYLPDTGKVFMFETIEQSGDTLLGLRSFWGEDNVDLGERRGIAYYKLGKPDIHLTPEAHRLLVESSLRLFEQLGLRRPVTWIQPGSGGCSDLYREEAKQCFGDLYGYVAAATYPNRALKCHCEWDPNGDKSFGMQWGDFDEETKDLDWNKKRIADGVAKHRVLIGHSHFSERLMPDGWEGFLKRIDGLLSWCDENSIPVKTYAEWAEILYGVKQDAQVNIFPGLQTDLNDDPDGYEIFSARLDRTDGIVNGCPNAPAFHAHGEKGDIPYGGYSLVADQPGAVCRVRGLTGLEKGVNTFEIWTKGSAGGRIQVWFDFPEVGTSEALVFPAENAVWTRHRKPVAVPPSASLADISIACAHPGQGVVMVSGMGLSGAPAGTGEF